MNRTTSGQGGAIPAALSRVADMDSRREMRPDGLLGIFCPSFLYLKLKRSDHELETPGGRVRNILVEFRKIRHDLDIQKGNMSELRQSPALRENGVAAPQSASQSD